MSRKTDDLLTTNARILLVVFQEPRATQPEVANRLGVDVSTVGRGLKELKDHGYVKWRRVGRGNEYGVSVGKVLIPESRATAGDLIKLLRKTAPF